MVDSFVDTSNPYDVFFTSINIETHAGLGTFGTSIASDGTTSLYSEASINTVVTVFTNSLSLTVVDEDDPNNIISQWNNSD